MTRAPAFLMSLLMRQLALAKDKFLTRYPHAWLVWEPGAWSVLGSGVDVSVAETSVPMGPGGTLRPLGDDALCFALKVPEGTTLKLGRAAENEVLISDLTVSRLHAELTSTGDRWTLTALSDNKRTAVDEVEVPRGERVVLRSGQVLTFGSMKVTFYEAQAFRDRVAAGLGPH